MPESLLWESWGKGTSLTVGNAFVMLLAAPCLTLCHPVWACPAAPLPWPPPPHETKSPTDGFWGDSVGLGNGG